MPVLVAYNLPYRDCAQYSAGGAADTTAYQAWIDGFARGIGNGQAIVILEPDGLGIIPYNTTIDGPEEWCKPTVTDGAGNVVPAPGASPTERYAQLNYAVDSLAARAPRAAVYLDASNSGWMGVGETAYRLSKAGVSRARGFFLNVSNYQLTSENVQYGTWISMAVAAPAGAPSWAFDEGGNFHFDWLPSQYDPALGYAINYSPEYAATVTEGIQSFMGDAVAAIPFVIDTSRNGQGPFQAAAYAAAPYSQPEAVISGLDAGNWCNGYGAGAGLRPTARHRRLVARRLPVDQGSRRIRRHLRHRGRGAGLGLHRLQPVGSQPAMRKATSTRCGARSIPRPASGSPRRLCSSRRTRTPVSSKRGVGWSRHGPWCGLQGLPLAVRPRGDRARRLGPSPSRHGRGPRTGPLPVR